MEVQLFSTFVALACIGLLRILYVYWRTGTKLQKRHPGRGPIRTLIVLGSGGHTAEMMSLVKALDHSMYKPRYYVAAATDQMSLGKARVAEAEWSVGAKEAHFESIYRSREVGQSYTSSIWTTLVALANAMVLIFKIQPEVILCNGPGTALPLCIAGYILKVTGVKRVTLIYVESIARVQKLSLTGGLLYKLGLVDMFFVQWPHLCEKYRRAEYLGRLM